MGGEGSEPAAQAPGAATTSEAAAAAGPETAPVVRAEASNTSAEAPAIEHLAPAEAAAAPAAEVATPAAPAPSATPRAVAQPYVLPVAQLHQIAEGAGLQWVNSDADKIAVAQAAIAAQPAAVHVPRERKPVVVVDEGPLVLVETRKDLAQLKLPFETGADTRQG